MPALVKSIPQPKKPELLDVLRELFAAERAALATELAKVAAGVDGAKGIAEAIKAALERSQGAPREAAERTEQAILAALDERMADVVKAVLELRAELATLKAKPLPEGAWIGKQAKVNGAMEIEFRWRPDVR
jgi:hypothetical protein